MLRTLAGLCYGSLLALLAIVAAGAGHGTYIPMAVSSAPFGIFGFISAAWGAPFLWGAVGALLHWVGLNSRRRAVIAVLAVHYSSALALAIFGPFADWTYIWRSLPAIGTMIAVWTIFYVVGQIVVWRALRRDAG